MESTRLTPFFLALLLAGSLVIAANAQSTASPSVTGADSLEDFVGGSVYEDQEELDRNLRLPADLQQSPGASFPREYLSVEDQEELNRNLRMPPRPNQPVCCIYCQTYDYNCLSNCVGDCREQDQCEGAGRGAYQAFCEENCPRTGARMVGSSPLVPIEACRGLCKKEVQELCLARSCSDVVPGCHMSNCSSAAPAKCG